MNALYRIPLTFFACFTLLIISACDWVDSAGGGEVDTLAPDIARPLPELEVVQNDQPLNDMPANNVIVFQEQAEVQIKVTENSGDFENLIFNWIPEPEEQGSLPACADSNGFYSEYAASTLAAACSDSDNCEINFERVEVEASEESSIAAFKLTVPVLRASVGLQYVLETQDINAEDADAEVTRNEYSFCLVAINEGPIANADEFVVTDGSRLSVTATDVNLLSNDEDDDDVRNDGLRVNPEPSESPASATFFELGVDGSFTYQADYSGLREERTDAFRYLVSDGVSSSEGEVAIRIVPINLAPVLLSGGIPPIGAIEGEPVEVDLARYFRDPEGGVVSFTFSEMSDLPPSGGLSLSAEGVFSGTPLAVDIGSYALILQANDGSLTTEATLLLEIVPALPVTENSAPEFIPRSVFSIVGIRGRPIIPLSPQFIDPDGDEMTYSMAGTAALPAGITIDPVTAVISGTPTVRGEAGNLRVQATDSFGASALSTAFFIRVN